jgi:hypothetical protein
MSLLANKGNDDTVRGLQGYAFSSPLLRFKKELVPPPFMMAAVHIVGLLFPKYVSLLK